MKQFILLSLLFLFSMQVIATENIKSNSPGYFKIKKQSILFNNNTVYPKIYTLSPLSITRRRMGPDIILGINTGINYSNITGSKDGNSKIAFKPFVGIFGRVKFSEATAYQLNINYSKEGYRSKSTYTINDGTTYTDDYKMNFDYIKIPVIARFSFGEKFIYNFNLGLYSSFLISAKQKGEVTVEKDGYDTTISEVDIDAIESFNKLDAGFVLGAGIEYALTDNRRGNNYSVFANIGLNKGVINISTIEDAGIKNFLWYSGIGVLILFDK